ncbi:MAG: secretin N-terminal domain-containing protein [Pirellulaceae bacterium]|nr:hypothetical protein [Planctomycetales bacterium]
MGERRVQQQQTPRRAAREGRAVLRRFSHGVVACMVTLMAGDVAVSQVTTVGTSPGGQVMEVVGDGIVAGELGEEEDATAGAERGDAGEVGDGETKSSDGAAEVKGEKAKDGSSESDKKKEDESDSIKRPKAPPRVPDPREFDIAPDKHALLKFSFHGQPWPDVLQWLASVGGQSLDWQELPDDYVNFTADRHYSVVEVRDIFNRLLFERGYTMMLENNILLVVRIEKLDPSLIRRVEDESQLMDLPAHDFVKFTFPLPSTMKANVAAEEVKPLLSRHAKVQPLLATNRLLVIDLVANLREISRLVNSEHAAAESHPVPREFPLQHARADQVADQIMVLLGLDPSSRRTPEELQVEQQRLQIFQQMQQQGKDISKFLRSGDDAHVYLTVNYRSNSILANAPPDDMRVIEEAIRLLDVPAGGLAGATTTSLSMEKYQLITLRPESVVTALEQLGDLDPRTRLKTDGDAKSVFAQATARDHAKIKAMIEQMDGTGRQFEVIWLRRLPADAVAMTIHKLMVGEEEDDSSNSRSYYYFDYYPQRKQNESPTKGFRVDADIENNRLLLWANDAELKEVRVFLEKLGELPGAASNPNTVRVLEPRSPDDTAKMLEQLRQAWPSIGKNPLHIEMPATNRAETGKELEPTDVDRNKEAAGGGRPFQELPFQELPRPTIRHHGVEQLVHFQPPDSDSLLSRGEPTGSDELRIGDRDEAAIQVSVGADGRVIISSRDTQALDQLEDVLARIAPPAKDYEVFYLKYALASLVTLNLKEYFEKGKETDDEENYWRGWYGFDFMPTGKESKSGPRSLGDRREIRFIYDYDTNSILVSNASPQQLEVVRSLVEIYDKPPSEDSISARHFEIFKLRYARAPAVAKTLKEVYRDLLSSKDEVFQSQGEKEQASQSNNFYRVYGGGDTDEKPKKIKASFAGALSVGTDEVTNTIIISAQEEWLPSISEMIAYLDREARESIPTVRVLNTNVNVKSLQTAISQTLGPRQTAPATGEPKSEQPKPEGSPTTEAPEATAVLAE